MDLLPPSPAAAGPVTPPALAPPRPANVAFFVYHHQNKSPHGVRCPGFERRSDAGVDTARCGSPPSVRATESSPCDPLGSTRLQCIPVQPPCSLAALVSRSRLDRGPPLSTPALQKRKNCTRLSARFTDTRCCRRTPYPVPARFSPLVSDTVPMPPPPFTRPQCMPVQLLCFTTFASPSRGSLAASLGECSDLQKLNRLFRRHTAHPMSLRRQGSEIRRGLSSTARRRHFGHAHCAGCHEW